MTGGTDPEEQGVTWDQPLYLLLKKRNKSGKSLFTVPWMYTWSRDIFLLNLVSMSHPDRHIYLARQ